MAAAVRQVGQPVMRADGGRLQMAVVIDIDDEDARSLLIAVKNGSRLLPGARIPPESCRCVRVCVHKCVCVCVRACKCVCARAHACAHALARALACQRVSRLRVCAPASMWAFFASTINLQGCATVLPGLEARMAWVCRELVDYVAKQQWDHAGARDWNVRLESCELCSDGKFHVIDRFNRRLRVTATPIFVSAFPSLLQFLNCRMLGGLDGLGAKFHIG